MKRGPSLLFIALCLVWVCLILIFGSFGWRFFSIRGQQKALNAKLHELRLRGVAIDASDLKRLHADNTSPESSETWEAIFAKLSEPEYFDAALSLPYFGGLNGAADCVPPRSEKWDLEESAKAFLVSTKALRAQLRDLGSNASPVYFPIVFEGLGGTNKHIDSVKQATNLVTFDAFMALRYNSSATVLQDIRALYGISKLLRGDPSVESTFQCAASEGRALEVVQGAIEQGVFSQTQLRELLEFLSEQPSLNGSYLLAVQGGRGMLSTTLDDFAAKQGFLRKILGAPKLRLIAFDSLDQLEAAASDDGDAFLKAIESVQNRPEHDVAPSMLGNSADYMASHALIPLYVAGTSAVRMQMHRRLAISGIGLQLYKLKHRKFPSELASIADVGLDPTKLMPVGGKPFGYRVSEKGDSAILWGFVVPFKKQTPEEPDAVDDRLVNNKPWVWNLR